LSKIPDLHPLAPPRIMKLATAAAAAAATLEEESLLARARWKSIFSLRIYPSTVFQCLSPVLSTVSMLKKMYLAKQAIISVSMLLQLQLAGDHFHRLNHLRRATMHKNLIHSCMPTCRPVRQWSLGARLRPLKFYLLDKYSL
jgi:hypothetical protein